MADDDTSTSTSRSDVDDINLGSPKPVKQGGSSPMTVLLFIIVIAVVAIFAYISYAKKQEEAEKAKARAAAETTRQAQLSAARQNVLEAIQQAADGNIVAATAKLQAAENQLAIVISEANTEDNQQAAAEALTQRQVVIEARKTIEAEHQKFQAAVQTQMDALRAKFGAPAGEGTSAQPPSSPSAGAVPGAETTPAAPAATPETVAPTSPATTAPGAPAPATTAPAPTAAAPAPTALPAPAPVAAPPVTAPAPTR